MRSAAVKRSFWIEAGIAVLLIAWAVAAFVRSEMKPLNVDELKINTSDLRSLAASGDQLADQFLQGNLTDTFFQTQTSLLQDKVKSTRKSLDSSLAEPDVQSELGQSRGLAAKLETAYGHLTDPSQDVGKTKEELAGLVTPLEHLEDGLKRKAEKK